MKKYIDSLKKLENPTFQDIRNEAWLSIAHLSKEKQDQLYAELNHGVNLLDSHEHLCKYLHSFGNMHEIRIHQALDNIKNKVLLQEEFDIIDWGCGQGLATITFLDYIKKHNLKTSIHEIILIEPSTMALKRARLHLETYRHAPAMIRTVNKFLDDVTLKDIQTDGLRPVIHFFSNILDIEAINLKKLAGTLDASIMHDNIIVCVGPLNANNKRINAFYNYFNVPLIANLEEPFFRYNNNEKKCTYRIKVYKLEPKSGGNLVPVEYYPAVQFHAGYELDCIRQLYKQPSRKEDGHIGNVLKYFSRYDTSAPFDIGASVYEDVHPILAVLNNIITRGLPTKASPFIERTLAEAFGYTSELHKMGEISYPLQKDKSFSELIPYLSETLRSKEKPELSTINRDHLQLLLSPIGIARIQKTILEAIITGKLDMNKNYGK